MTTAEKWLLQFPPDVLTHPLPFAQRLEYAKKIVTRIQADAMNHAAELAEKVGDSIGQSNPSTGELSEKDAYIAEGCYEAALRLRLEVNNIIHQSTS
jgi:hypothetical protein